MTHSEAPAADGSAELTGLLGDGLGRRLGLGASELRVGLEIARSRLERGAFAEALRIYVALVLCDPREPDYQVGLANCALRMDEHTIALQAASAVIMLAPRDPRGYFLSGRACIGLGQVAEATEDLQEAIRLGREARNGNLVEAATRLCQSLRAVPELAQ